MSSYWKNQYQNRGEGVDGPTSSPLGEAPEVGAPSSPEDKSTVQAAASPTPRPWQAFGRSVLLGGDYNQAICVTVGFPNFSDQEALANAELICRAVNAHD